MFLFQVNITINLPECRILTNCKILLIFLDKKEVKIAFVKIQKIVKN